MEEKQIQVNLYNSELNNVTEELTVDDAFTRAGGFGRYQYMVFGLLMLASYSSVCFVFCLPYILVPPAAQCLGSDGLWAECDLEDACARGADQRKIDVEGFLKDFNLYCDDLSQRLIFVAFFVGNLLGGVLFNTLGDVYGRLPIVTIGTVGMVVTLIMLVVTSHEFWYFEVVTGLVGFFTMGSSPAMSFTYESAHSSWIPFFSTFWQVAFALCEIVVAGTMATGASWQIGFIAAAVLNALYFCIWPFLRETVKFDMCKGRIEKAHDTVLHIARINGLTMSGSFRFKSGKETALRSARNVANCTELCINRTLRVRLMYMIAIFFASAFVYYGISIKISMLAGNVYLNGTINGLAEALSCAIGGYFSVKMSGRKYLVFCFAISGVGCLVQRRLDSAVAECIFIYAAKFGISATFIVVYTFIGQAFPSAVSSTTVGISFLTATMANIVGAMVTGSATTVFSIMGVACLLAMIPSAMLPEVPAPHDTSQHQVEQPDMRELPQIVGKIGDSPALESKTVGTVAYGSSGFDHLQEGVQALFPGAVKIRQLEVGFDGTYISGIAAEYAGRNKQNIRLEHMLRETDGHKETALVIEEGDEIAAIQGACNADGVTMLNVATTKGKEMRVGDGGNVQFEVKLEGRKLVALAGGSNGHIRYLKFYSCSVS